MYMRKILKTRVFTLCVLLASLPLFVGCTQEGQQRKTIDLNSDWRFTYGDDSAYATEIYADSAWQSVELPHVGECDSLGYIAHSDIVPMNVGWYRRHFASPHHHDKVVYLKFDSLPSGGRVYINGTQISDEQQPEGVNVGYNITPYLHAATHNNVIAVRTEDCSLSGGVSMVVANNLFIECAEVATLAESLSEHSAVVHTVVKVANKSSKKQSMVFVNTIHDAEGKRERKSELKMTIAAKESFDVDMQMQIPNPVISDEYHYKLRSAIVVDNCEVDVYTTPFSICRDSKTEECNETAVEQ